MREMFFDFERYVFWGTIFFERESEREILKKKNSISFLSKIFFLSGRYFFEREDIF